MNELAEEFINLINFQIQLDLKFDKNNINNMSVFDFLKGEVS
jgi:hypothetical protein